MTLRLKSLCGPFSKLPSFRNEADAVLSQFHRDPLAERSVTEASKAAIDSPKYRRTEVRPVSFRNLSAEGIALQPGITLTATPLTDPVRSFHETTGRRLVAHFDLVLMFSFANMGNKQARNR